MIALLVTITLLTLLSLSASVVCLAAVGNTIIRIDQQIEAQQAAIDRASHQIIFETRANARWVAGEAVLIQKHLGIERTRQKPDVGEQFAAGLMAGMTVEEADGTQ